MSHWSYARGLHDLGNSVYAYLQPAGTWGWSNAGIIVDSGTSLLVDTLFDLELTQEMLTTMRRSLPEAQQIDMVVNTHANGDHYYGNQLVSDSLIIASRQTAEEMYDRTPEMMAALLQNAPFLGNMGAFTQRIFGSFHFEGISVVPPKQTFEGRLDLKVGSKEVQLLEVGPAHTRGDTLIHIPADKTIFTGDILFIEGHPIMWAGPVGNWIRACELILNLDVETIVPGHGPITDKQGVQRLKGYFEYLDTEVRKRYEAGLSVMDAAKDINIDAYAGWNDAERLVVNVASIYRELEGDQDPSGSLNLFGLMAEFDAQINREKQ